MRTVPRLCEVYPDICLTTEGKARKNLSQGSRRVLVYILHITNTPTQLQYPHIHTPTLLQNTHTHTHTLQNPHIHTPTHYKIQTHPHNTHPHNTHPHSHTHTHTHTHTPTRTHTKHTHTHISNKMQRYTGYLFMETLLHVSGGTSTHHQEHTQLYLQRLVLFKQLLIAAGSCNCLTSTRRCKYSCVCS